MLCVARKRRDALRGTTPGEPGDGRRCAEDAEQMRKLVRHFAPGAKVRPDFDK